MPKSKEVNLPEDNRKPSEVTDDYWIFAHRKISGLSINPIECGKWMVFVAPPKLNEVWEQIKTATEEGRLGPTAKTSTALDNPNATDTNKALMVYTYDGNDEADVWRVREELRRMGFTQKLYWKADATTRAGIYSNGGRNKSWRYTG